jgi:hypothetical protein
MTSPNAAMTGLFERPLDVLPALSAISVTCKQEDSARTFHGQNRSGPSRLVRATLHPFDPLSQEFV